MCSKCSNKYNELYEYLGLSPLGKNVLYIDIPEDKLKRFKELLNEPGKVMPFDDRKISTYSFHSSLGCVEDKKCTHDEALAHAKRLSKELGDITVYKKEFTAKTKTIIE